jgi:hypothetical protein
MAAVVIARRHRNPESADANEYSNEQGKEKFVEYLPPPETREFDVTLGTLLLG